MFADDIKIWRVISKVEDSDQLQQDLYKLASKLVRQLVAAKL